MQHPTRALRTITLFALLLAEQTLAQTPALKGLDPVRLCGGEELPGLTDFEETRGGYTYRFATAANLATFRKEPTRYEIQLGGACARMGPLSGLGDPDRFHVHAGRIYIFASNQCREGFQKRTELFLDHDTPRPQPTAEQAQQGEQLRQRAIEAHGGLDRLRSWRTYRQEREQQNADSREHFRVYLQLPQSLRIEHDYLQGDKVWRYARTLSGDDGFFVNNGKPQNMAPAAHREMLQVALREPLFALRRSLDGGQVATANGKQNVAGLDVDEFELWQHGCSTLFGVDPTGRIRTARFRGRGPQLWFGDVVLVFDDFETASGLVTPKTVHATFNGDAAPSLCETRTKVEVDVELPNGLFVAPK